MEVISISFLGGNEEKKLHWGLYFFGASPCFTKQFSWGRVINQRKAKIFQTIFGKDIVFQTVLCYFAQQWVDFFLPWRAINFYRNKTAPTKNKALNVPTALNSY